MASMFWIAVLLGLVEGLTEFLPVSSTGHLIVTSALLGFEGERAELFEIFIQLGAILGVVVEFRQKLFKLVFELPTQRRSRTFAVKLLIAFLPLAIVGLALRDLITTHLFNPQMVAWALIVGAILILIVEGIRIKPNVHDATNLGWGQAAWIGLAQMLALWPGFSRSAATILGGVVTGLDRRAATEFSFFLAIPVMMAAGCYDLYSNFHHLQPGDGGWLSLSFAISFVVGWAAVRWLLKFVATHTFRAFAYYRIVLGCVLLIYFH